MYISTEYNKRKFKFSPNSIKSVSFAYITASNPVI